MKFVLQTPLSETYDVNGAKLTLDEYEYDVRVLDHQTFVIYTPNEVRIDYHYALKHDGRRICGYFILTRDERRFCSAALDLDRDVFDWRECPRTEFMLKVFHREDTMFR